MVKINGGGGEWGFVFDSVGQTKFGNLVGVVTGDMRTQ